jgi:hypothetical protein
VSPESGAGMKRDQLRAVLAHFHHSVVGDDAYGPLATVPVDSGAGDEAAGGGGTARAQAARLAVHDPLRRLGVHLAEVRLTHPTTKV